MKIIIAGSRCFADYAFLRDKMKFLLSRSDRSRVVIVSGAARGADALGERFARECGFPVWRFPARWREFGRSAGYIRNKEMASAASHCVIFRVGRSKGSTHMYNLANQFGLACRMYDF